jgi:hypothetical protein
LNPSPPDITFTWHEATPLDSPILAQIPERIRLAKEEARKGHEKDWPISYADDIMSNESLHPGDISGSELWFLPQDSPLAAPPLPDPLPNNTYDKRKWGEVACWHTHFELMRKIANGDDDVVIIFEDDIDMEWDLERRLRHHWQSLPDDWGMVMLGAHAVRICLSVKVY